MRLLPKLCALVPLAAGGGAALAHVEAEPLPASAGTSQEITFTVGHGCTGLDTFSVRIEIPAAVTAVRTVASSLGTPALEKNDADLVSAVVFTKAPEDVLPADTAFYKMTLRLRIPDAPFTTLHFPATQICRSPDGATEETVLWTSIAADHDHEHAEEGEPGPAPAIHVLPARLAGWNRYTVPAAIDDLADFFGDARIVWKGSAAYSANPLTTEQIGKTAGVTALTTLAAGDEIWVKY